MEDYSKKDEQSETQWQDRAPATTTRWLVILSVALFAAAVFAGGYALEQNSAVSDLKQQNSSLNATEGQLKSQIDALTTKMAQMTAPPSAPETQANGAAASGSAGSAKPAAKRASGVSNRQLKQMQTQIADQQKQLKQTQDDLASARTDLQNQLGSTRDELNGSIAKTHDELVVLEKRGDRLFFEFDLSKAKTFQREGPIQLSLRRADAKHQNYDVMMLVNDHELAKRRVDLYEPISLHEGDLPQPVQVVVNRIDKNRIHGYVSSPKYKESELASMTSQQPAADSTSGASSTSGSSSPSTNSSTPSSAPATTPPGQ